MWPVVRLLPEFTVTLPAPSMPPPKVSLPAPVVVSVLALFKEVGEVKVTFTF